MCFLINVFAFSLNMCSTPLHAIEGSHVFMLVKYIYIYFQVVTICDIFLIVDIMIVLMLFISVIM